MKRPLAAAIGASLFAWNLLGGCATVLELDGYQDAASALCACPGFELVASCAEQGKARLEAATDAEREAWLGAYDAKKCGSLCERAAECYDTIPGCGGKKPGCDCCVWNGSVLECSAGAAPACQTCRSCSELAIVMDDGTQKPCVSARVLLFELEQCACSKCASDCTGFCQHYDLLQGAGDTCSPCLESMCKPMLDACLADKP